jgi:nitric oxide dioxygenase
VLSSEQLAVVKATTPVVGANVSKITSCFYATMFKNDPGSLHFFNEANQQRGFQQEALAEAIVAYATNIENLGALAPLVEKIAHRHVSLSVTPPLYQLVHKNLMAAIADVLGAAVTPEIAGAWSQAVLDLAKVCITTEEQLYEKYEARRGGWRGEREFRLVDKKKMAAETYSFKFVPTDGYAGPFDFTPGQYMTIRMPKVGAAPRHYTLTSSPGETFLQCTTRKVRGGVVSTYMHDKMEIGAKVRVGVPCGVLKSEPNPNGHVLVSAGIGVTPMSALAKQLGRKVKAIWCLNSTKDRAVFVDEFINSGVPTFSLTTEGGRPDLDVHAAKLVQTAGESCSYYLCGPVPFMAGFSHALYKAGVAQEKVHMQLFGTGNVGTRVAKECPVAGKV